MFACGEFNEWSFSDLQPMSSGTLRWRHNGHDSVSNHQPHGCLLKLLFRRRSKKTSKLRVTGLCVWNSTGTGEFPAQMASNAENVSIWWRHYESPVAHAIRLIPIQCCETNKQKKMNEKHVTNQLSSDTVNVSLSSLRWRHNELDGVSDHQPHDCLLNRLFGRRSKKTSKLRVTGLCAGNSPGTGEFSAQMASNAENVSIWWRRHYDVTWDLRGFTSPEIRLLLKHES